MGWIALSYDRLMQPILQFYPHAAFSLTTATMTLGFILGLCLASVNILGQTTVQRDSPAYIRGRVLALQFMLSNLVGIPPMLALGGLADVIGIPRVMEVAGLAAIGMALLSLLVGRMPDRSDKPTAQ